MTHRFRQLNQPVSSDTIAVQLQRECTSQLGIDILSVDPLKEVKPGSLTYYTGEDPAVIAGSPPNCVVIACGKALADNAVAGLASDNPRLDFIRALEFLRARVGFKSFGVSAVTTSASASVHTTASVGAEVCLGDAVEIGAFAQLTGPVIINRDTVIASGAKLGQQGFGYERNERNVPEFFPHLGGIVMGEHCYIGANTTIARGVLENTVLGDNVKVDDGVYIAHHCHIGARTMIAGGARLCGGVVIGEDAWIGAGSMIRQGVRVGDRAVIGLGAVVIKDVEAGVTVAGNPAKVLGGR